MKQLTWSIQPISSHNQQPFDSNMYVTQHVASVMHTLAVFIQRFRIILATLFAVALFLSPPLSPLAQSPLASAAQPNNTPIITRSDAEVYYLNAVNSLRASRGLTPLVVDARLTSSASQKGNDMVLQKYWAHFAPNGTSFSDYIWRTSPDAQRVGENLARCFDSRQDAFDALVASPSHYAIMTGQFTNFGVSEVEDAASGCTYVTMHFADYEQ